MKYLILLLLTMSCSHHKVHMHGHSHHHRFDDAEKWAKIFEDTKRDVWQHPDEVIARVGVKRDSKIADIGSATGYFPVRLAKRANKGRVWGVDVEPNLVNYLNKRARTEEIKNLFSIHGTFQDPLIPEPVDFIFVVNTYHHIEKRNAYFSKLRQKYLNSNGSLIIVDFKKGELPFGPKDAMKLSSTQVIKELNEAGFKLDEEFKFLPHQYLLKFKLK